MWVFKYLHSLLSYIKYVLSLSMNFNVENFFSCVSPEKCEQIKQRRSCYSLPPQFGHAWRDG